MGHRYAAATSRGDGTLPMASVSTFIGRFIAEAGFTYICYALAALLLVLHACKGVIVGGHIGQDRLLIGTGRVNVFRIEQAKRANKLQLILLTYFL